MTPFSFLQDFVQYLEVEKRYSQHTVLAYQKDIEQFFNHTFNGKIGSDELKEVSHSLIRSWIIYLNEEKLENKSINRKLVSLRSFFKWLLVRGEIEKNPFIKVSGPKVRKRLPTFVKENDIKAESIDFLFSDDFEGKRDRLMFELLYQTGIRLNELINLRSKDISTSSIKVLGKRNKERIIPISEDLSKLIINYKSQYFSIIQDSEFLLTLFNGNKIYPKLVYRKINYYLSLTTNMDKKSPHVLRHTFATHMLNNGAGLETLKELLGHASLAATQVYTHNSFAELTTIYSSAHPRGGRKKI